MICPKNSTIPKSFFWRHYFLYAKYPYTLQCCDSTFGDLLTRYLLYQIISWKLRNNTKKTEEKNNWMVLWKLVPHSISRRWAGRSRRMRKNPAHSGSSRSTSSASSAATSTLSPSTCRSTGPTASWPPAQPRPPPPSAPWTRSPRWYPPWWGTGRPGPSSAQSFGASTFSSG